MTGPSIQDRTSEFSSILGQAQRRLGTSKVGSQRQALLTDAQRQQANGSPSGLPNTKASRSEFARRARDIGKGITGTTAKLQRLAECEYRGCPIERMGRAILCSDEDLIYESSGQTKDPLR